MLKQKTVNLAESNIANLGSELEKKVRLAASQGEAAWAAAGKAPGLQIWRIEQFKVVPVPQASYGCFFGGDSYIVLHTYKKTATSDALAWDVHFWLGLTTTQDEAGTAAYKTVELDDHLGGAPVQHREVQDWESALFLSYFPKGVRVLEGGTASGFTHVEAKAYQPRLLQLKGKRHIRLREVPLKMESVNSGDVFILDRGLSLIQFNGTQSGALERARAAEICRAIDTEREGKPVVTVFEQADAAYPKEWTEILGSDKSKIRAAAAGGDDLAFERTPSCKILMRLSDTSGKLTIIKVAEGAAVTRSKLDTNDVFIIDVGNEVFAWIGRKASAGERKTGMRYAEMYLREVQKPPTLPISRVLEGAENDYFLSCAFGSL